MTDRRVKPLTAYRSGPPSPLRRCWLENCHKPLLFDRAVRIDVAPGRTELVCPDHVTLPAGDMDAIIAATQPSDLGREEW